MAKSKKSTPPRQTAKQLAQTPLPALVQQKLAQALALAERGRADEAYATLRSLTGKAGSSPGKSAGALLNAAARKVAKRHPATALAMAREAVRHEPGLSAAWLTIAVSSDQLGEHAAAHAACRTIVDDDKADPIDVLTACDLLVRFGDERLALASGKRAFAALGRPLYGADRLLYIALRSADWALAGELIAMLDRAHREGQVAQALESPHNVLMWCDDPAINVAVATRMATLNSEQATPPWRGAIAPLSGRRIRVGYLSSDFREHATAWLVNGLFRHHDREKFELFMYCSGWDDGSAIRRELESHMDHVCSVARLDNHSVAELIRSHKIDVLVELNGLTRAGRLEILAERVAPVQIDYLGFPGSVGGRGVDYIVADDYIVPPGGEALYPEKLIRIGDTYQVNDYAARKPPLALTRAQVGLPDRPVVVAGMFNHLRKVRGEVWAAWMRILKAVPNAVMWVLDPGELARENIRSFTAAAGVDPERIYWAPKLPQETHLMRLQCCDLILDPWPCGGHTTLTDALFVGVPHVCLQGRSFAARVNGSLLRAAELDFLVQHDVDSYVDLAVLLLRFPEQLAAIKRIILDNVFKTDVFNAESKTRQLEVAYKAALERVIEGLPPEHLSFSKIATRAAEEAAATGSVSLDTAAAPLDDTGKPPVILVCSPWHSGGDTLFIALARLGLPSITDPEAEGTADEFTRLIDELVASENLQRQKSTAEILRALLAFRNGALRERRERLGLAAEQPLLLAHPLATQVLEELEQVFDLRIIVVRRTLDEIEAIRAICGEEESHGQSGATVIYSRLFDYVEKRQLPFKLVKYQDVDDANPIAFSEVAAFCEIASPDLDQLAATRRIPRKLHIIWVGDEAKRPDNCIETWRERNPDWELKVWGNKEFAENFWLNKAHMLKMWERELNGVADMMRWEILFREGGLVVDADSVCVKPLSDDLLDCEAFACWESEIARPGLIAAGYFGCRAENLFVARIIADIHNEASVVDEMAWKTVGPQRLTDAFRRYRYHALRILPSHYFIPEHFTGVVYDGPGPIYARQMWGSTKRSYDGLFLKRFDAEGRPSEGATAQAAPATGKIFENSVPAPRAAESRSSGGSSIAAAHPHYFVQRVQVRNDLSGMLRHDVFSKLCADLRVLHVGCADWPITDPKTSLHLALEPACATLDGFDIHAEALAALAPHTRGKLYSRFEDIDDEYDLVLVPEVIEHVPDVARFLAQIDSLRAHRIVITAPDAWQCHTRHFEYAAPSQMFTEVVPPDHNCWYTPYTLSNVINKYTSWKIEGIWFFNRISLLLIAEK